MTISTVWPDTFTHYTSSNQDGKRRYPLRPELAESTYFMYGATGHERWMRKGRSMVESLQRTRVECGHATVTDVAKWTSSKDAASPPSLESLGALEDEMPSFFLSETLKYLYLLFDEDNPINQGNYIFNTEAHPFPVDTIQRLATDIALFPSVHSTTTRSRRRSDSDSDSDSDSNIDRPTPPNPNEDDIESFVAARNVHRARPQAAAMKSMTCANEYGWQHVLVRSFLAVRGGGVSLSHGGTCGTCCMILPIGKIQLVGSYFTHQLFKSHSMFQVQREF